MKTDYQNINLFEVCVTVLSIAGVALTIVIMFMGLTPVQRNNVLGAVRILDVHEHVPKQVDSIKFVFQASNDFLDEFYLAFTETMVLSESTLAAENYSLALESLLNYSDQLATNYRNQNSSPRALAFSEHGTVLGAVIEFAVATEPARGCGDKGETTLDFPYHYQPPALNEFWPAFQFINN